LGFPLDGSGPAIEGEGPANARIVFIGEAPGKVEVEQGRPFVGPSGELLRDTLDELGIDIREVYITNVVKCRPPNNRTPSDEEVAACMPHLEKELDRLQPEWFVLVGRTAAQACLKMPLSMEGKANTVVMWRGRRTLISYHPAAVLRDGKLMNRFEAGLRLLIKPKIARQETLI
jgi:DNA polymerase